jgi:D-aminopeptidase
MKRKVFFPIFLILAFLAGYFSEQLQDNLFGEPGKLFDSKGGRTEPLSVNGPGERVRARDIGIEIGIFEPGKWNAITDVKGVKVGHATLIEEDDIRTGVTAILPHPGNLFQEKVPCAVYCGNGFGKLTGSTQIEELGTLETPILLANTLSVGDVASAVVDFTLSIQKNKNVRSVNPVVGETNDGYLNDIQKKQITAEHVFRAIQSAKTGPVEEGSVGAGTGTVCMGWKGGIGTSSRVLPEELGGYTIGVLVQTNFGGILSVNGAPVGRELGKFSFQQEINRGGSCMIVVATNAPLDQKDLERLAKRAIYGLAKVGGYSSHGSGDYVLAFTTSRTIPQSPERRVRKESFLQGDYVSPLFCAVVETTEEAILNSLLQATSMSGWEGHRVDAIPVAEVRRICEKYGVLNWNSKLPKSG